MELNQYNAQFDSPLKLCLTVCQDLLICVPTMVPSFRFLPCSSNHHLVSFKFLQDYELSSYWFIHSIRCGAVHVF